jgi:short-subunit dehydrogenase
VGLVGRREALLAEVLDECQAHAPDSRMWVGDLADLDLAERIVDEAVAAFGDLDVLINNAAIPMVRPAQTLTAADVEAAMAINFFSPARMTMRVLPRMIARDAGVIVNVASVGGRMGIAHEAAYCASKFALTGWSESLAIDLHGTAIKVRLVQPGPIDTDIWDRPGTERAVYDGPLEPPSVVAEGILAVIEGDGLEHYFPDMKGVVSWKDGAIDEYIATVGALAQAAKEADP